MFAYFGDAFVKISPDSYMSKINGLIIDRELSEFRLINRNQEAIEQFQHLYNIIR